MGPRLKKEVEGSIVGTGLYGEGTSKEFGELDGQGTHGPLFGCWKSGGRKLRIRPKSRWKGDVNEVTVYRRLEVGD
jgi:hypothetical protein